MDDVNTPSVTPQKNGGGTAHSAGAVVNNPQNGRFTTGGELTEKQRAFVQAMLTNGGNATKAAAEAGYGNPHTECWRVMRHPGVIAELRAARERYIQGPLASKALACLEAVMSDPGASPGARVQAAKYALDAAGHGLAAQLGAARLGLRDEDKPLSEMNASELEEFLRRSQATLAGLKDVSRAVSAPVIELKP